MGTSYMRGRQKSNIVLDIHQYRQTAKNPEEANKTEALELLFIFSGLVATIINLPLMYYFTQSILVAVFSLLVILIFEGIALRNLNKVSDNET